MTPPAGVIVKAGRNQVFTLGPPSGSVLFGQQLRRCFSVRIALVVRDPPNLLSTPKEAETRQESITVRVDPNRVRRRQTREVLRARSPSRGALAAVSRSRAGGPAHLLDRLGRQQHPRPRGKDGNRRLRRTCARGR